VPPGARDWIRALAAPWPVRIGVFGPWRPELWEAGLFDGVQSTDPVPGAARFAIRTLALPPEGSPLDPEERERLVRTIRSRDAAPDAWLLDARRAGVYGGTGRRVDADLARILVEAAAPTRVVLAGGLNADNVAEAVQRVRPWAVDVGSGVEASPGVKDRGAVLAFIQAARRA